MANARVLQPSLDPIVAQLSPTIASTSLLVTRVSNPPSTALGVHYPEVLNALTLLLAMLRAR